MYKFYRVKTTHIDYCVEDEDVIDTLPMDDPDDEDIEDAIDAVKASLPQVLELEIECEPDDLDDMVCDAISEETGWLVDGFTYDIIEEN